MTEMLGTQGVKLKMGKQANHRKQHPGSKMRFQEPEKGKIQKPVHSINNGRGERQVWIPGINHRSNAEEQWITTR